MNGDRNKNQIVSKERQASLQMVYTANPSSKRLRQEAVKLKASLGYALTSRLT